MSLYQINIDDNAIVDQINNILNTILQRQLNNNYSDTGRIVASSVKDLIYSRKDEIIDKVVDRAAKEIVRKGLPRLLEMAGDTE